MNIAFAVVDFLAGLFFLLTAKRRFGTWINPSVFFSFLWMVIAGFSNFGLMGYYAPSTFVNLAMLSGALIFQMVMLAAPQNMGAARVDASRLCSLSPRQYRLIAVVNILCFILSIPLLIKALQIIGVSGWTGLRTINFDPASGYKTNFQTYFQGWILEPCGIATLLIGLWVLFQGEKKGIPILFLGIINAAIISLTSAGRNAVVKVVTLAIITFFMLNRSTRQRITLGKKEKRAILLGTILCCLFVVMISSDRSKEGDSLLNILYTYHFTGPSYLSQLLNNQMVGYEIGNFLMLGWATFGFVLNLPMTAGLVLGLGTKPSSYYLGSVLTSSNLQVGDGLYGNSMCTCYYDFLLDWGYAGILIGPFLLGLATIFIITKVNTKKNIFWASVFVFWLYTLYRTIFKWDLVDIGFSLTIVFLFLFSYPRTEVARGENR